MSSAEVTAFVASELRKLLQEELRQWKTQHLKAPDTIPLASAFLVNDRSFMVEKESSHEPHLSSCRDLIKADSERFTREGWQLPQSSNESRHLEQNCSIPNHPRRILSESLQYHEEGWLNGVYYGYPSLQSPCPSIMPAPTSVLNDSKPLVEINHSFVNERPNNYLDPFGNFRDKIWKEAPEEITSAFTPSLRALGNDKGGRFLKNDNTLSPAVRPVDGFQHSSPIPTDPTYDKRKDNFSCLTPLPKPQKMNPLGIDIINRDNSIIPPLNLTPSKTFGGNQTSRHRLILQRAANNLAEHVLFSLNGGDNITVILALFSFSPEMTPEGLEEFLYQ
ncbi:unnamed protein product [Phytomonas sp. Hart1]|nr:unnamed protein product [Phytomonas sp. Hart1]|eukprot:CCW71189.1 unnamed protein product [Phytomonas sp. isolate Hart1]